MFPVVTKDAARDMLAVTITTATTSGHSAQLSPCRSRWTHR